MRIKVPSFKGLIPRLDDTLLPNEAATVASNVNLKSGALRPLANVAAVTVALNTGTVSSIYKYGAYWLSWVAGKIVDVVRSPVAMDAYNRLYWTGDGTPPKMGGLTKITSGGSGTYPVSSFHLGIPAPTTAVSDFYIGAYNTPGNSITLPNGGSVTLSTSWTTVFNNENHDGSVYIPFGVLSASIYAPIPIVYLTLNRSQYKFSADTYGDYFIVSIASNSFTVATIFFNADVVSVIKKIVFADGAAIYSRSGTVISLGGTVVPVGSASAVVPVTFDTTLKTPLILPASGMTNMEARTYVCTYVSEYGEEGMPSADSAILLTPVNATVTMNTLPNASELGTTRNITKRRLYRSNTGSQSTEYQLVAELDMIVTTYADSTFNEYLGEVIPSKTWGVPATDLVGLISLPCGSLCGYRGNEVRFSVPYLPHAWDAAYTMTFTEQVKGLGVFGTSILVATDGAPYVITGQSPGSMSVEQLESGTGCTATRGVVDMGYVVVYPSTEGLVAVGTSGVSIVTEKLMTKAEWNSLFNAATLIAFHYDSQYIVFSSAGNYVLDPRDYSLTSFTLGTGWTTVTGGWHDKSDGSLYLTNGSAVAKWETGTGLGLTWKSKRFVLPEPVNFGSMEVIATVYPVVVSVWADGVLIDANPRSGGPWTVTKTVTNERPFPLPAGFTATSWQVQIANASGGSITSFALAETTEELGAA